MAMKFDPTVNLGHVLTMTTMLGACVVAYGTLAQRVTVQEQLASERAVQTKDALVEIKTDVKELRHEVQSAVRTLQKDR